MIRQHKFPVSQAYSTLMFEFKNSLLALRKDFTNMKWGYDHEKEQMNGLIAILQDKYHLNKFMEVHHHGHTERKNGRTTSGSF